MLDRSNSPNLSARDPQKNQLDLAVHAVAEQEKEQKKNTEAGKAREALEQKKMGKYELSWGCALGPEPKRVCSSSSSSSSSSSGAASSGAAAGGVVGEEAVASVGGKSASVSPADKEGRSLRKALRASQAAAADADVSPPPGAPNSLATMLAQLNESGAKRKVESAQKEAKEDSFRSEQSQIGRATLEALLAIKESLRSTPRSGV